MVLVSGEDAMETVARERGGAGLLCLGCGLQDLNPDKQALIDGRKVEGVPVNFISTTCSNYTASLLKKEFAWLILLHCFSCHLVTVRSQQGTVTTVMSGPTDWLSRLWQRATSRVWFHLS